MVGDALLMATFSLFHSIIINAHNYKALTDDAPTNVKINTFGEVKFTSVCATVATDIRAASDWGGCCRENVDYTHKEHESHYVGEQL